MSLKIDIIEAIKDPNLIGGKVSIQQEILMRVIYGLPLPEGKIRTKIYTKAKGFHIISELPMDFLRRATDMDFQYKPGKEYREAGIYLGARSGKSDNFASNIACYEANFRDHNLSKGEFALIPVIAKDKKQGRVVYKYTKAKLEQSPALSERIRNPKAEEIELTNDVIIGIYACNFSQMRGYGIPCSINDEVAIWANEETGVNPATEVIRALRRGMATYPNAKLIKISSPFAKEGLVWDDWRTRKENLHKFIVKIPSWEVNPTLMESFLLDELREDPEFFWREFGAEFWESANALIPPERIDAAVTRGVGERPYKAGYTYTPTIDVAFTGDNFAFCISHREMGRVVVDFVRAWKGSRKNPPKLSEIIPEIVKTVRAYGCTWIHGDQFCSEPMRQIFADRGIEFRQVTTTQNSNRAMYSTLRTLAMSENLQLPDDAESVQELKGLKIVTAPGGSVKILATGGRKKDRATVIALSCHLTMEADTGAESWVKALKASTAGQTGVVEPGRTKCADCGNIIPIGEPYYGLGGSLGQCMPCSENHGAPTYDAVRLPPGKPVPLNVEETLNG